MKYCQLCGHTIEGQGVACKVALLNADDGQYQTCHGLSVCLECALLIQANRAGYMPPEVAKETEGE